MAPLEDYAVIGDTHTAALVNRDASIDWLCLPRLDSDACFAALLGNREHGHWSLGPVEDSRPVSRAYRQDTLVLRTELAGAGGVVRVIDCMPVRSEESSQVVRLVEGVSGRVRVRSEVVPRFDYGRIRPRAAGVAAEPDRMGAAASGGARRGRGGGRDRAVVAGLGAPLPLRR